MSQMDKAQQFKALHVAGKPLVLYNIWDAGGARTVAGAGARAIATGSWSVAAAHAHDDREEIPLDLVLTIVARIAHATDLPLTVDFEGGYAAPPDEAAANVARVLEAGAVGINFEDQVVKGSGLYSVSDQAARIAAIRNMADRAGIPLFINARTDLFLKAKGGHASLLDEALARQRAYSEAGADGFFVPGLTDKALIASISARSSCPVNVMMSDALTSVDEVAALGVARASFGPTPYRAAQVDLLARFRAATRTNEPF